jgi:predicted MFS family arabinose efflux permease
VFDVIGTIASGWLTDRYDPRWLLFWYYGLRGISLLGLNAALNSAGVGLAAFVIFDGLDWVATVPPTIALCRKIVESHGGSVRSCKKSSTSPLSLEHRLPVSKM